MGTDVERPADRLRQCEAEVADGLRSWFKVGRALREIRDSRLYLLTEHKTFEAYCAARWDISKREASRAIEAAAVVVDLGTNCPKNIALPAAESHARALSAVRMELRAGVWQQVVERTGGRPTARAVTEAAEAAKRDFDAAEAVTAAEKAAYREAYEAARRGGGGQPAYDKAGREAVMAYRREHPAPAAEPSQGKEPVSADEPVIDSSAAEDSRPGGPGKAAPEPVQETVTVIKTETPSPLAAHAPDCPCKPCSAARPHGYKPPAAPGTPDPQPCLRCAPQIAELEQLLADRSAELKVAHERITKLEEIRPDKLVLAERDALAERVTELEARSQIAPYGAEQADPPTARQPVPEAADSARREPQAPPEPKARHRCGSVHATKASYVG